jgi:hypothetical protein
MLLSELVMLSHDTEASSWGHRCRSIASLTHLVGQFAPFPLLIQKRDSSQHKKKQSLSFCNSDEDTVQPFSFGPRSCI